MRAPSVESLAYQISRLRGPPGAPWPELLCLIFLGLRDTPCGMGTRRLMAGGIVIALVVLTIVLLFVVHPSGPPIRLRHVNSVQFGNVVTATFEVTNLTGGSYIFLPGEVEVRDGSVWIRCFEFENYRPRHTTVGAYAAISYTCQMTNLPTGSALRVKIRAQKVLTGLNGFIRRFELNLRQTRSGRPRIPLNPFDKKSKVFGLPSEVESGEFLEPEPKREGSEFVTNTVPVP
jgi:hypothetical protein